jgi:hypothetical protein
MDESARLAARDERHHPMRLRLQAFRKFAHIGVFASGIPLDMKEHQILKRCNAVRSNRALRKSLESAHLITKFGQLLESRL